MKKLFWSFAVLGFVACNQGASVGEPCGNQGRDGECVDDAVCAYTPQTVLICVKRCVDQSDCPKDTVCTRIPAYGEPTWDQKGCIPSSIPQPTFDSGTE